MKKLSRRETRFVKEYFKKKFNASRAALAAGYSPHTVGTTSWEILHKPHIQLAIERELKKWEAVADVEIKDIIQELKIIAFADLQHYVDVDPDTGAVRCKGFEEMPPNASRAIESINEDRVIREIPGKQGTESILINDKRKFKLHSKKDALELLGKFKGLWDQPAKSPVTIIMNFEPHSKIKHNG
jgi:phage terminase small subunit